MSARSEISCQNVLMESLAGFELQCIADGLFEIRIYLFLGIFFQKSLSLCKYVVHGLSLPTHAAQGGEIVGCLMYEVDNKAKRQVA